MSQLDKSLYKNAMRFNGEDAPGGIIVYYADGDEEIIHVNQYVIDLFECDDLDDFLQLTGGSFRGFVHGDDIDAAEDSIWGQVDKHDNFDHIYYRIRTKTGRLVSVDDYGKLVERPGERPVFYVFVVELKERGAVDWLTGLPAMARFNELAEMGAAAIRSRGERPVAVALDLVGLKSYNTRYGRDGGDRLLCTFADMLRQSFGSEACSRFGEDHYYAFAAESTVEEDIQSLFERFGKANDGRVLPVRVGLYACDPGDDIVAVGLDRAKIACDLDRKTWQSHAEWFSDEMRADARLRIYVLENVDHAISEGWIEPYYQAIVRSSTGLICGEEALARWVDPDYGPIYPDLFVPLLEEAGLLQKLDMYMVDRVLADLHEKRARGVPVVPVSVNVSLRDLGQVSIAEEIMDKADAWGVPYNCLRIEFTESAATDNPELFVAQVGALRDAGFSVWMDDFGSGYSSLNMLRDFEFDLIKLDMGFVKGLVSEKGRSIVSGVVQVALSMGVEVLAEGVEEESQALLLESMGCSMLQGYYYAEPLPIDQVIAEAAEEGHAARENELEFDYWHDVMSFNLANSSTGSEGHLAKGSERNELPAGVMERRGDTWSVLRANRPFREFLDRGGAVPLSESNLKVNVIERGADEEFVIAADKTVFTGAWERVAGRMEYGTGLQVFTRRIASSLHAEAFALTSVPVSFGTALGYYGDVPVAYAVLRVILNQAGTGVYDAEYVFANSLYCRLCNYDKEDISGRSFRELSGDESDMWFEYCYRAVVLGEETHDVLYSPEVGHWLSFNISPSPVEGCCAYAFTVVDDERREREEMIIGRDTSDLIIGITNALNSEVSYDAAMQKTLAAVSDIVHPDRLYVLEHDGGVARVAFEWLADGVESNRAWFEAIHAVRFDAWEHLLSRGETVIVEDVSSLESSSERLYRTLVAQEVERMLAVPLVSGGELLGFLVAENYELEEGLDVKRLIESVASFASARIANQRLVDELERAGTHDGLTGVLNRRGIDLAAEEWIAEHPGEPFVLALMDVDDFKALNDMYGHNIGDAALIYLAQMVSAAVSGDTIVGRNGGDEFLMLLFGDDAARADDLARTISEGSHRFEYEGKRYQTSLSIGYVGFPDQVDSLQAAYAKADVAVYAVKLGGKSGYRRYSPELETQYRTLLGFSSRDLAENIPVGIMVHKAEGRREILFANDEIIDMLECDSLSDFMDFTGGAFDGLALPEDLPRVRAELARQIEAGGIEHKGFSDYRVHTKSGKVVNVYANSRLDELQDVGKVFYVVFAEKGAGDDGSAS